MATTPDDAQDELHDLWDWILTAQATRLQEILIRLKAGSTDLTLNPDDPRLGMWFHAKIAEKWSEVVEWVRLLHELQSTNTYESEKSVALDALGSLLHARRVTALYGCVDDELHDWIAMNDIWFANDVFPLVLQQSRRQGRDSTALFREWRTPSEANRVDAEALLWDMRPGSDQGRPADTLPELKPHDRQAWQLATLHGMTQHKVASALNKEHGTNYTQGQVSRMIARAKAHVEASGLAEKLPAPIDRPRTVDPKRLELGARVDKRKPRPSDMARADEDEE